MLYTKNNQSTFLVTIASAFGLALSGTQASDLIPTIGWLDPSTAPGYAQSKGPNGWWPKGDEVKVLWYGGWTTETGTPTMQSIVAPIWGPNFQGGGTLNPPTDPTAAQLAPGENWMLFSNLMGIGSGGDCYAVKAYGSAEVPFEDAHVVSYDSPNAQTVPDPTKAANDCPWDSAASSVWNRSWYNASFPVPNQ